MGAKFGKMGPGTEELAALERLRKSMDYLVTTLVPLFLIGSSSFLQITRTTIKSQMGSTFCQIRPLAAEFASHERQENFHRFIMEEML